MSELPRKYCRMKRGKLNELAIAGNQHAQKALRLHQTLDRLTDSVEQLGKKMDALASSND